MPGAVSDLAHPDLAVRLAGLASLHAAAPRVPRRGTNVHVHSNHSFSSFASATEAAWLARQAGIEVFGIDDLHTTGAYGEFREACRIVGQPAVFGLGLIAADGPERIRICAKAVTRPDDASAQAALARLRGLQEARNRALVAMADGRFRSTVGAAGPSWQDVIDLTPLGNTTERHVARAIAERIRAVAVERSMPAGEAFLAVVGQPLAGDEAEQQAAIGRRLLGTGGACHRPEDPASFLPPAEARDLCLRLGAVPTCLCPEDGTDVSAWCDRLATWGVCSIGILPARHPVERVAAIVAEARHRGWPVCDGTGHDTPAGPLTTRWGLDERFRPVFRAGALVLLGHQELVAAGQPGYLGPDGHPTPNGYQRCLAAGERRLSTTTG